MNTKICTKCGIEKPLDQFPRKSESKDGYASQCKECKHKYYKVYYDTHKDFIKKSKKKKESKLTQYIRSRKADGCVICGEKDLACLDFHHLRDKEFVLASCVKNRGMSSINKEIDKCVVLCANCHRKLHFYNLTLDQLKSA